jgi:hypothetical protein
MGAAAAGLALLMLLVFAATWIVLPRYVTTAAGDREIEEWSPPMDIAGAVLTPKGMAAAALSPNENLGAFAPGDAAARRVGDAR